MEQKRCNACMQMKSNVVCEHCGFDERTPTPRHQLPAGIVLNNQFRIGRALGQGGFGITYMGWDLHLETPVAIKEYFPAGYVHRDCSVSMEVVENQPANKAFANGKDHFIREAKSLARLSNVPEIVHIKSFFQANGTAYIVMEYVRGITLNQYVRQQGYRLTVPQTLNILKPVMEALAKVHDTGLIHRDISPDNIMLLPNGKVKLLDFGAARDNGNADPGKELPKSTQAVVKNGFAPIEQYQRRGALGTWTDVYALCATFFYCVAGSAPASATDRMVYKQELDWVHLAPGLTQQQMDALNRGLALSPKERTGSVRELYYQLFGVQMPGAQAAGVFGQSAKDYPATVAVKAGTDYPATVPVNAGKDYPATVPANAMDPIPATEAAGTDGGKTVAMEVQDIGTTTIPETKGKGGKKKGGKTVGIIAAVLALAVAAVCFFTVHIWSEPSCTEGVKCILCGKAGEGDPIGHDWQEATCLEPSVCVNCGETEGEALGHNWVAATCDVPEHCTNCGESVGTVSGHNWTEATYEAPKTCTVCGQTSGESKGWVGRVYGKWEKFYRKNVYSDCYVLNEPMETCKTFTLNITINSVSYGSVEGKWEAFIRNEAGEWLNLGYFDLTGDKATFTYHFDEPTEVYAVAAVPANAGACSYNWSLSVTDVVIYVD